MSLYRIQPSLLSSLIIAQALVLLPYYDRLSPWISLVFAVCAFWRLMVAFGYWSLPKNSIVSLIAVSSGLLIFFESGLNRESALSLLAITFSLKLLELKSLRDSMLIVFLGYLLIIIYFLYSNSVAAGVYGLIVFLYVTFVLIGLNRIGDIRPLRKVFKKTFILVLQALPLALVTFMFFPRLSIPLWQIQSQAQDGITGFSQNVELGSISQLAQSEKVAFRVKFLKNEPRFQEMYWRGMVLSNFNGKSWSPSEIDFQEHMIATPALPNKRVEYEVFMEPSHEIWLFALENLGVATGAVVQRPHGILQAKAPVQKMLTFKGYSDLGVLNKVDLTTLEQTRLTEVLDNHNPKTKVLAIELLEKAGQQKDQYVKVVLDYFKKNKYFYTFAPGALGDNPIDQFLFKSKSGFCEHYASSFAYLMRLANIPARVIVGYQSGEYNPYSKRWVVKQYQAHAWTEIWLDQKGWHRVDPTLVVAPDRALIGMRQSYINQNKRSPLFFDDWIFKQDSPWFNTFYWGWDALDTWWNQSLVNYSFGDQSALFRWLSYKDLNWQSLIFALALFITLVLLLILIAIFSQNLNQKKHSAVLKEYLTFCHKLEKHDLPRLPEEGPVFYLNRVTRLRPDLAQSATEINQLYIALQYKGEFENKNMLHRLRDKVSRFRP